MVLCSFWQLAVVVASLSVQAHCADIYGKHRHVSNATASCARACRTLIRDYPNNVLTRNTTAYVAFKQNFWSANQGDVDPYCVFQPTDKHAVAAAIRLVQQTQCPFAAKSGGHASFAGASSIENGITIDFKNLNEVVVSSDRESVDVGPGNTWGPVYKTVEKSGVIVIGGRLSDVGVGGLTLGGGISFLSNMYGWGCDNVINYELVGVDGVIRDVNRTSYPDLYWALRGGGGGNFGLVTKFTMQAYPQGKMWGGQVIYNASTINAQIDAFEYFAFNSPKDPKAALIVTEIYAASFGGYIMASFLEHADPVSNDTYPPIFQKFKDITPLVDGTGTKYMSNITDDMAANDEQGARSTYWQVTSKVDTKIMTSIHEIFRKYVDPIRDVPGILPSIAFQAITVPQMQQMQKNGGNALGLDPDDGPYLSMNMGWSWNNAADDERVVAAARAIINESVTKGKELGLDVDYIYLNYASEEQDVYAGYGEENERRLRKIARRYDPEGVFQKLRPGYHKLWPVV